MVQKDKFLLFITFLGFILGILYINLIASNYLVVTGVFNSYYLQEFVTTELKLYEYLPSILWQRLSIVGFLLIIAYSSIHKWGVILFCAWTGFLYGAYMSLGIAQLGIAGIVLSILGMFPHMLFYLPAYIILMIFAYQYPNSKWSVEKIIVILLCMIVGIVLECKVNPEVIRWFVNMM